MKLDSKNTEIIGQLTNNSKKASISQDNLHKLWALIEKPYKNSIGSIVREYVSNSFDSHAEAGVTDAVMVKFTKEDDGFYISFIDVGVGISEDRMTNIFMQVFATTKDTTDDMIGAYGQGSKAGLSYQSHFIINTHVDGTTYNYIYRKGQIEPELDLLDSYQEDRRNGTEIKIKIKSESDLITFVQECNRQLYYFENVVFDYKVLENYLADYVYNLSKRDLNNDFKIHEGNNYKVRINNITTQSFMPFNRIHICNGPVAYPIDFNNIKVDQALQNIPIGLKFNIGELDVIQTREDVRYTDKTIKAITDKLEAVKQELIDIASKTPEVIHDNYKDYKANVGQRNKIILGKGDYTYEIQSSILPSIKHYLKGFYKIDKNYNPVFVYDNMFSYITAQDSINHTESGVRLNSGFQNSISNGVKTFWNNANIYILDYDYGTIIIKKPDTNYSIKTNKQLVFKDNLISEGYQLPVFIDNRHRRDLKWFKKSLNLSSTSKSNWRDLINLFLKIEEKKLAGNVDGKYNIIWYDDVKLDEKWYSDYAKANRKTAKNRDNTKYSFMFRDMYNNTWVNENYDFQQLLESSRNSSKIINPIINDSVLIIEKKDNKDVFLRFDGLLNPKSKHKLAALAPRNYDKLVEHVKQNNITNVITYDEFLHNKNNIKMQFLKDIYKTYLLEHKYSKIFEHYNTYSDNIIKCLFPKMYSILDDLYIEKDNLRKHFNYSSNIEKYFKAFASSEDEVLQYCKENDNDNFFYNLEESIKFTNLFNPVLPTDSYYSKIGKDITALFCYYFKPYNTNVLLNTDIKFKSEDELKLILDTLSKGNLNSEDKVVAEFIIMFYQIRNQLSIGVSEFNINEVKKKLNI